MGPVVDAAGPDTLTGGTLTGDVQSFLSSATTRTQAWALALRGRAEIARNRQAYCIQYAKLRAVYLNQLKIWQGQMLEWQMNSTLSGLDGLPSDPGPIPVKPVAPVKPDFVDL